MSDFKPRRCRACNGGTITPQTQGAVAIPTCDGCGEQWVTRDVAVALDNAEAGEPRCLCGRPLSKCCDDGNCSAT